VGMRQPEQFHPEGDVFTHTVKALSLLNQPARSVAWSALLHDIGKPPTLSVSDRIRFFHTTSMWAPGWPRRSSAASRRPTALRRPYTKGIDNHMNFMNVKKMRLSTLKKFLSRPTFEEEMELHRVDCLASHGDISKLRIPQAEAARDPPYRSKAPIRCLPART